MGSASERAMWPPKRKSAMILLGRNQQPGNAGSLQKLREGRKDFLPSPPEGMQLC